MTVSVRPEGGGGGGRVACDDVAAGTACTAAVPLRPGPKLELLALAPVAEVGGSSAGGATGFSILERRGRCVPRGTSMMKALSISEKRRGSLRSALPSHLWAVTGSQASATGGSPPRSTTVSASSDSDQSGVVGGERGGGVGANVTRFRDARLRSLAARCAASCSSVRATLSSGPLLELSSSSRR